MQMNCAYALRMALPTFRANSTGPPRGAYTQFAHTLFSVHLRFNNIKVITIIALAYNEIAWLHLPLEHRIQHLVHLQQREGA